MALLEGKCVCKKCVSVYECVQVVSVSVRMCVRMGVLVGVFTLGDVVVFVVHDASLLCDLNLLNVEPVICLIAVHTQFLSVL